MFCSNCGNKMEDGVNFCASCGTNNQLNTAETSSQSTVSVTTGVKKLHCPQCGSHNLSITTESSVNGAVTSHHGAFSSSHVSNTHRNFWVCTDCGAKFRNIQSLQEEIKKTKSQPIVGAILAIIALILAIYFLTQNSWFIMYKIWGMTSLFCAIIFAIFIFVGKNKLSKLKAELDYLQKNCF